MEYVSGVGVLQHVLHGLGLAVHAEDGGLALDDVADVGRTLRRVDDGGRMHALVHVFGRIVEHAEHGDNAVGRAVGAGNVRPRGADVVDMQPDTSRVLGNQGTVLERVVNALNAVRFHGDEVAVFGDDAANGIRVVFLHAEGVDLQVGNGRTQNVFGVGVLYHGGPGNVFHHPTRDIHLFRRQLHSHGNHRLKLHIDIAFVFNDLVAFLVVQWEERQIVQPMGTAQRINVGGNLRFVQRPFRHVPSRQKGSHPVGGELVHAGVNPAFTAKPIHVIGGHLFGNVPDDGEGAVLGGRISFRFFLLFS